MAQTYQRSAFDYDGMQRSERRPSRGTLHAVDRGVPYVAYPTRPDHRFESRTYVLPTPIHDIDQDDSDPGSSKKRTSIACSRCRKRKIKCSGGHPCQACRSAGVDTTACLYHRVGTNQTFDLDTSVGGPSPMAPTSPYSPVSPVGAYPAYPTDARPSMLPTYNRTAYSQGSLPGYSYDGLDTSTYGANDGSRSWSTTSRPSTAVSYYQQDGSATYDYPTPISRISGESTEPLSPLDMSALQYSLPLPLERRLPAPNLVGSPIAPDNDMRNPISARLSSLSINGPYTRSSNASWALDGVERRQASIHDLAEASMMLPPVTRGLTALATTLPAMNQDTAPISTAMFVSSPGNENLSHIQASTGALQPAYYAVSTSTLPSLTTGMLPPTNYTRYNGTTNSSLPVNNTSDRTDSSSYYGWTSSGTSTDTLPLITTLDSSNSSSSITTAPQSTAGAARRYSTDGSANSSTHHTTGYPPLHHPRPKIVPSTPHATTLEKHDRVQQQHKDDQHHRRIASSARKLVSASSGSGSGSSSSGSGSSSSSSEKQGKKSGRKPSKGGV